MMPDAVPPRFTLVHRDGTTTESPPLEAIGPLLRELDDGGAPSGSVTGAAGGPPSVATAS